MNPDIPPFGQIPSLVWSHHDLLESDLRVFGVLCSRYNQKTRQLNPGHLTIAQDTGLSVTTVRRSLLRLRELGYVGWLPTQRGDGGQGAHDYYIPPLESDYGMPVPIPRTLDPLVTQVNRGGTHQVKGAPGHLGEQAPPSPRGTGKNIEVEQRSRNRESKHRASDEDRVGVRDVSRPKPITDADADAFMQKAKAWQQCRAVAGWSVLKTIPEGRLWAAVVSAEEAGVPLERSIEEELQRAS